MNNDQLTPSSRFNTQAKAGIYYTEEELKKNTQWYEETMPKPIENKTIIKAKIIEITPKHVVLDTGFKFDGTVALTEFKDLPDLKAGDEVEVYVDAIESKQHEVLLSRKKLETIKGWKIIEEAFATEEPIEVTIIRTSPGGLIGSIHGIEVFLPGSQIDLKPVTDHDSLINTKLQVIVVNINLAKKNVIVSRKLILKNTLEGQKKAIIEKLEEGQVLEGVVKNIEKYGAFIDLGGITGLVYIGDMVWNKRIDDPSKAKDEEGNPMFEKGKKVKVVVLGFDKEKNHVSLATKPLLPNPWEKLAKEVEEGSVISCKVIKIMDYGAIVETEHGIEAFMYSSDISLANYPTHPKEILTVGQELKEVVVLHIDTEKQSLRVGLKQLMPDPWQADDFFVKYGLDTRHKAKVTKFTEHGAYLSIEPGVDGFLHNRHLSWTKKINAANKVLKRDEFHDILIIGIDESKKILELGYRELEESPWDKFQNIFVPGSIHKGTILRKIPQGLIVQLAQGPEVFVSNKDLTKQEKTTLEIGKELDFMVIELMKYEEKIRISHDAVSDPNKKPSSIKKHAQPIDFITADKTRLEDIALVNKGTKEEKGVEEEKKKLSDEELKKARSDKEKGTEKT